MEWGASPILSTRSFNYWDIVANISGIVLAWLTWPLVAYFALPKHANKTSSQGDQQEK